MRTITRKGQSEAGRAATDRTSVGAGVLGLVVTLVIFTVVFVGFLIAPLVVLGLAFLAYLLMRPRQRSTSRRESDPGGLVVRSPGGFGSGAS
ncbi:hypothetical protein [Nocardioides pacificus]